MKNKLTIIVLIIAAGLVMILLAVATGGQEPKESDYLAEPAALQRLVEQQYRPYSLLDVRTPQEFGQGYIPTAVNLPLAELSEALPELLEAKGAQALIILYCRTGNRSATAARRFYRAGFTNVVDAGGIIHWPGELVR